jgi:hypothetical protein
VTLAPVAGPAPKFDGTVDQPPVPHVVAKLGYSQPIMVDGLRLPEIGDEQNRQVHHPVAVDAASARGARRHLEAGLSRARRILGRRGPRSTGRRSRRSRRRAAATCNSTTWPFAYLCDPKIRETCRKNGDDPEELPRTYARPFPGFWKIGRTG